MISAPWVGEWGANLQMPSSSSPSTRQDAGLQDFGLQNSGKAPSGEGEQVDIHTADLHTVGLHTVAAGQEYEVVAVAGEDALSERLAASGLWRGAVIERLASAPFGDPVLFRLHGYRLALRRSEAERVTVTAVVDLPAGRPADAPPVVCPVERVP